MKLLIRNLPRKMSEEEVRAMVEDHGKVQSCNLVMDTKSGLSKGFAFVEMPKPGEAKAATKYLNGKEIDGNRIRVKKAEAKKDEPAEVATEAKVEEAVKETKPSVWKGKR